MSYSTKVNTYSQNIRGKLHAMHSVVNAILSLLVFCMGIYLVVLPLLPILDLTFQEHGIKNNPAEEALRAFIEEPSRISSYNRQLIIPQIGVHADILSGDNPELLDRGIWLRPNTAEPAQRNNSVLVGHRFQYTSGNNTFYHLDKLVSGDEIYVVWNDTVYRYIVEKVFIVDPDAGYIEAPTNQPVLTLYTCTPLWTASRRLVVRAVGDLSNLHVSEATSTLF